MTDDERVRVGRGPMTHELKTWPRYFAAVIDGSKTFEVRNADRDFRVGDHLLLREWNPTWQRYTDRKTTRVVTYILDGSTPFGFAGFVVMAIAAMREGDVNTKGDYLREAGGVKENDDAFTQPGGPQLSKKPKPFPYLMPGEAPCAHCFGTGFNISDASARESCAACNGTGKQEGEARAAGGYDLIALVHRACAILRTIVTDDEANIAALAALAAAKVTTLEDRAIDADNDRDGAKREAASATERAVELAAAIDRGGLDLSPCRSCSCLVACIRDGLPYCDGCASAEEKRQTKDQEHA